MAGSQFTEEQIRRGLLTLAMHGGNSVPAARELQQYGIEISERTLREWKNDRHSELYRELHRAHGQEIEQALVPEFRELAQAGVMAARKAIDKTVEQMDAGELRDPASAARNLTVTAATAMDKLYLATDRPTERIEQRDVHEVLAQLAERLPPVHITPVIETTAVEIVPHDTTLSDATNPPPSNPPRGD